MYYTAGEVNGTIGMDTVSVILIGFRWNSFFSLLIIGLIFFPFHQKIIDLTATNQRFGLATRETAYLDLYPFDGILGLAYATAAKINKKTLLDQLYEQGQIKNRIFCVKIQYKQVSSPSEFLLGGCDTEAQHWLPVVRKYLWTVTLNKIVLTSTTNNIELLTIETNAEAMFDTGGTTSKICGKKWNK